MLTRHALTMVLKASLIIDLLSFFFGMSLVTIWPLHVSLRFMRDPEGKPLSRGSIQKLQIDPLHCLRRYVITLVVVMPFSPFESCPSSFLVSPEPALLQ